MTAERSDSLIYLRVLAPPLLLATLTLAVMLQRLAAQGLKPARASGYLHCTQSNC